ncbi:MAG: PilZ domain-containing protein [Aeromonadaceae bacterium]
MDNNKPHPLLDQLIPLLAEPDFDDLFTRLTHAESTNTRFLLKMELKRRATPCIRIIDMRARYPSIPYIYAGIQHFMSQEDIEVFQTHLRLYRGRYTMGVYEAVLEAQKLRQHAPHEPEDDPHSNPKRFEVEAIHFASYYGRREERMHFSSTVKLHLANGAIYPAKTSDISLGGVKLSLGFPLAYEVGELCQVTFDGLHKESPSALLKRPINYQILGDETKEDKHWIKLLRVDENAELDQYFQQFIDNNKLRYRISIDYLLSSAEVKGYEQYYLPRITGLPLFFSDAQDEPITLRHVLRTENNQHELEYWRNERNEDMLAGLFPETRMHQLLAQPGTLKQTIIYCFTHTVRSHIYYFSATREELEESGLKQLFFAVGACRPSWRVFKLDLEAVHLDESGLDNLLADKQIQVHYEEVLRHKLLKIGYVGLLQAIDDDTQRREYLSDPPADMQPNRLQIYGHRLQVSSFELELLHYTQLRKEQRYLHKTAVAVKCNGQVIIGWTRDISTHGLQVELEQPLACEREEVIRISLPKLQEMSRSFRLHDLPYRVVNNNTTHTVLHLCIDGDAANHEGRRFFNLLIESNSNKLKTTKELRRLRGMATALRNLYTHHLFNYPLYLSRTQGTRLGALGCIANPRSLHKLFSELASEKEFNLTPLFQHGILKDALLQPLRRLQREDKPLSLEIFVCRKLDQMGNICFDTRLATDFIDLKEKKLFVQQALNRGNFTSVRLFASRTGRPDVEFIANELDYIAKYAIHKARHLEETLWSVMAVCDLVDTTAATLYRLGFSR